MTGAPGQTPDGTRSGTHVASHAKLIECMLESPMSSWCWPDCSKPTLLSIGNTSQNLGYAPNELGDDVHAYLSLVHAQDKPRLEEMTRDIVAGARSGACETEFRVRRKDGTYSWVRMFVAVTFRDGSGPPSAIGVTRIVGPNEELHNAALQLSKDALHTVLNEIGYPVVLMTLDGVVLEQNSATARILGQGVATSTGRPHYCPFLHEADGTTIIPNFVEGVVRNGRREDREVWRFDRWWHVFLVPLRNNEAEVRRILLLAQDISALKAEQEAQLAREKALTRTLVREVHHRIKNHLQGLVGLLRSQPASRSSAGEVIDNAVIQIQSIAAVHGLLSLGSTSIEFSLLVKQIVDALRVGSPIPVSCIIDPPDWKPFCISQEEAVPLAVAVGELLMNAVKHTPNVPDACVQGRLSCLEGDIELCITNAPARLPAGFSLSGSVAPSTGLDLVTALLPRDRATLDIVQAGTGVKTRLRLRTKSSGG